MASLDVKTAFDVAKPAVVSKILTYMVTHGLVVAALFGSDEGREGFACFETLRDGVSLLKMYLAGRC